MLSLLQSVLSVALLMSTALASPVPTTKIEQRDLITRNDLFDLDCLPVTVIFARGTIEPGNVGLFAGPPFFDALANDIGAENFAVQGVDYDASIAGYLVGGSPSGSDQLAYLANYAVQKCPDTQIVLSGYSQGAQVVHNGANTLGDDVTSRVAAVVLFGDPDEDQPISDIPTMKIDTICFQGDLICDGLPIVLPPHLAYGFTAQQGADFVAGLVTV